MRILINSEFRSNVGQIFNNYWEMLTSLCRRHRMSMHQALDNHYAVSEAGLTIFIIHVYVCIGAVYTFVLFALLLLTIGKKRRFDFKRSGD